MCNIMFKLYVFCRDFKFQCKIDVRLWVLIQTPLFRWPSVGIHVATTPRLLVDCRGLNQNNSSAFLHPCCLMVGWGGVKEDNSSLMQFFIQGQGIKMATVSIIACGDRVG